MTGPQQLLELAKQDAAGVIRVAVEREPPAIVFAKELDALCNLASRAGCSPVTIILLLASATGHAIGTQVDTDKPNPGAVVETFVELANIVVQSAAEHGYADNLKENGNAGS